MMKLEIREATIEDSQNLYDWRIHPINSEYSVNGSDLPFEVHEGRLNNHLSGDKCLILIIQYNDEPCCVVRFDREWDDYRVSIYMIPGFHGLGLGLPCLLLGERYLRNKGSACNLVAEIMYDNDTSMKLFKRAGYVCENNADISSDWVKTIW